MSCRLYVFFVLLQSKSEWWRYFNVYVYTSDYNKNKVTGICGNFNGNALDDTDDFATLNTTWSVPPSVDLTSMGRVGMS